MEKLYCTNCKQKTQHTPKLSAIMEGKLVCRVCSKMNGICTLTKTDNDDFFKSSLNIKWVEWEENSLQGKELHDNPQIGFSLLMSPFNAFTFTWQTTPILEIIESKDDYVHFKTKNSEYKLYFNRNAIQKYSPKQS